MVVTKTHKWHCILLKIIMLCTYSLFCSIVNSEEIVVGGSNRWTDGFDYVKWAQQQDFKLGDVLVFSYTKNTHNVYDVTKAAYQSCDSSNGVNAMYESGNDHVELKEAKQYWFICTVESHCTLGMKFGIDLSAAATNSTTSNATTTSDKNFASSKHFGSGIYLVAAGILSILVSIC